MVLFCLIFGGLFGFFIFFLYFVMISLKIKTPQPCHSSIKMLSSPLVVFFLLNDVSITITTLKCFHFNEIAFFAGKSAV